MGRKGQPRDKYVRVGTDDNAYSKGCTNKVSDAVKIQCLEIAHSCWVRTNCVDQISTRRSVHRRGTLATGTRHQYMVTQDVPAAILIMDRSN